jgi:hypothetical protein
MVVDFREKLQQANAVCLGLMCRRNSVVRFRRIEVKEIPEGAVAKKTGDDGKAAVQIGGDDPQPAARYSQCFPGPFQPELTSRDTRAWQMGDPMFVKLKADGLWVGAGANGNYLLSRRADCRKTTTKIELATNKETEAFLAVRAGPEPEGWHAITSGVWNDGGKTKAGMQ